MSHPSFILNVAKAIVHSKGTGKGRLYWTLYQRGQWRRLRALPQLLRVRSMSDLLEYAAIKARRFERKRMLETEFFRLIVGTLFRNLNGIHGQNFTLHPNCTIECN
jgi:hypothetical protein